MSSIEHLAVAQQPFNLTLEERLVKQFYTWERRGRGWDVWPFPIDLEPPFRPFLGHYVQSLAPLDDARKPSWLQKLFGMSSGTPLVSTERRQAHSVNFLDGPEEPTAEREKRELDSAVELQIATPPSYRTSKEVTEQFLLSLSFCSHPLGFEIVGTEQAVTVQLVCDQEDAMHVRGQLRAYFPDSAVSETRGFLASSWTASHQGHALVVDFGLSREFMLPLQTVRAFEVDPLIGLIAAISHVQDGEVAVIQVLLQHARYPWDQSIMRAVTDGYGSSFFADAPEILSLAKQKVAHPLFAAVMRIAAKGPDPKHAWSICKELAASFRRFANPAANELIPLTNDNYDADEHEADVLARRSQRCGMLLNLDEITSIVHLPSASVQSEKLVRETQKSKPAPLLSRGHSLILGENRHGGRTASVTMTVEQRLKHTYVIGASGTGKSTLLLNMIIQDVEHGEGVAVLDPHGDLIDDVVARIPENRFSDIVLLDPSDEEYPVGFNILSAHSELEKNLLASDLVAAFRRLSTSWGDQMNSVLANGILAILESTQGGTLADLRRFLIEPAYRREFLLSVRDPGVVYYWEKEFPLLAGKPQGPILTRLDTFLRPKLIRHMVAQKDNRVNLADIMSNGKILLAKLSQGAIGEENACLLGTLLVSKLHQLAMARQEVAAAKRRPFFLYIDEFHNFVTPSLAALLSGARKYHLGLVLAHQELHQLMEKDAAVASAVIANPYTRICFRLGDFDAKKLAEGFSVFEAKDLQNLEVGQAICRMERSEYDFNLRTLPLSAAPPDAELRRERIVTLSREQFATAKGDVEAYLGTATPMSREMATVAPQPARVASPRPITPPTEERREARQEKSDIVVPPLAGRGGGQHKYLQELIRRWAVSKGYRTLVEEQILDGLGSVDVALHKEGLSIACEISVSTSVEHELQNVQKCLAAGFGHVILLSPERKTVAAAKQLMVTTFDEATRSRVQILTPEEFFDFVETLEVLPAGAEGTVHGYKVKVRYRAVAEGEEKSKKQAISNVILGGLKKYKK